MFLYMSLLHGGLPYFPHVLIRFLCFVHRMLENNTIVCLVGPSGAFRPSSNKAANES